ncbi:alkyl sulfatase dimerization domain-containing protein [Aeromonas veronii]|uniref:alkyl/aryl-sulfatase n=2 Tax=Aeromonas TaxID=642 RepID=UPI002852FEB7|nr:alkyl sulfatase dimerization domain-containing protein [Aeromonas veronii]MDR5016771.1 alkyl sulfatase dimerization domain-containing protein [Aeromonas veronii]
MTIRKVVSRISLVAIAITSQMAMAYDYNTKAKEATPFTKEANERVYQVLDFNDQQAFADADRGFIAPLLNKGDITGVFSATAMNYVQGNKAPESVNPSLWRHAQLVNRGGLYKVSEHIYQVRGQDLSNLTIIETNEGMVFYDVEYSGKALKASIELYEQHRGKRALKGVIISHSHADHFGGFGGIYEAGLATPEDVSSGKLPVLAPEGFVEEAVSENVMGGNIMARRAGYQYGNVLKVNEKGIVTSALGPALANDASSLPIPNHFITKDNETVTIDGVDFVFYLVPHTEAPSEMVMFIPQWGALSMAEDVNHLQHNIYTLRGAQIRDSAAWAKYINQSLGRWGEQVKVHFGPHTWPVWGNGQVVEYLKNQRDLYQSLFDTTMRYANYGYGPDEIAENAKLPKSVFNNWDNRPYYGNLKNNLKSTYIRNLGWFDGNAAKLAQYPDDERGKRYVEAFGGEDKLLEAALNSFNKGDYRFAAELLNNIVASNPANKKAVLLMADSLEQLGYQDETTLTRNLYLSGAQELRMGGNVPNQLSTTSPEVIAGLPGDMLMPYLGMVMDQVKAEQVGNHVINLILQGDKQFGVDLHNGVFNSLSDYQASKPDVTLEIDKPSLLSFLASKVTLDELIKGGKAKVSGDSKVLEKLPGLFDLNIKNNMNLVLPLQTENQIR